MDILPPILFEDDHFVAFDKPSGLLVSPDRWDEERENLMRWVHKRMSPDVFNAHRLDAGASGVLLCAKTRQALRAACAQFLSREVEKEYVALTLGAPPEDKGTIQLPLLPDRHRQGRMRVSPESGKPSETLFEVVERWRGYALVRLNPLTGRQHQIRVHLAALKCPIIGDPFYGRGQPLLLSELKPDYKFKEDRPEKPLMGRLALHSSVLTFKHPVTGQPMTVKSPLPKDFQISIKYLRRWAGAGGSP